jgi:hypothetical protein
VVGSSCAIVANQGEECDLEGIQEAFLEEILNQEVL